MPPYRKEFGKCMSDKEYLKALEHRLLTRQLRKAIQDKSSDFYDKHKNHHSCLTVSQVMILVLEDKEVSKLKYELCKLEY